MNQTALLPTRPKGQLLKWIGSKFKFAHEIVSYFPDDFNRFIEPFVGTGAILATVAPTAGIASDTLKPLIELWNLLQHGPEELIEYYERMISAFNNSRQRVYNEILKKYNDSPNSFDLLIISRTCYGGMRTAVSSSPRFLVVEVSPGYWHYAVPQVSRRENLLTQSLPSQPAACSDSLAAGGEGHDPSFMSALSSSVPAGPSHRECSKDL